jgi:hypothetical protein
VIEANAAAAVVATGIAATVVIASAVRAAKKVQPKEQASDVDRSSPSLLPPPQELPLLRPERAED